MQNQKEEITPTLSMETLSQKASEVVATTKARLNETAEQAKERARGMDRSVRNFVDEKPMVALAMAAVAGYLVARIARR